MSRHVLLFLFAIASSLISLAAPLVAQAQTGPSAPAAQDINKQLFDAVANDNLAAVRRLLAKGADVNAKNNDGETPVNDAIGNGYEDIVKLFLENGAALNTGGIHDPLYQAAFNLNTDIVGLLLKHGAKFNAVIVNGQPLLTYAVQQDRYDMVKLLLANGADVNVKGSDGDTPLLKVVCNDSGWYSLEMVKLTMAKLLVENRANVNAEGSSGSVLQCAERRRFADRAPLVKLLKAAGATGDLPPTLPPAPAVGTYYVDEMMTDTLVSGPFSSEDACKAAMTTRFGANAQHRYICVSANDSHGSPNAARPSSNAGNSGPGGGWHGPGWYVEEDFLGTSLMAGPYPDQATCWPVANQHRSEWDTETGPYGCFYWDHDPDK